MSWIEPKCLKGYKIARGCGRIERTPEGEKQGIPEPIIDTCCQTEGLCWWLRPIGFSFSLTLPIASIKNFWKRPGQ